MATDAQHEIAWPVAGSLLADRFELIAPVTVRAHEALYPAKDRLTQERVALRIWPKDSKRAEAYRQGIKLARTIQDPWVVKIFDFGFAPPYAYALMEWSGGKDLKTYIQARGALDAGTIIQVLRGAGNALAAAHRGEILHRNLQSEKVMMDKTRMGRILDFGLCMRFGTKEQLQSALNLPGDPAFAPPERFTGKPMDARSDIYSLALVIQHAFTGLSPYEGKSVVEIIASKTRDERPPMEGESGVVPVAIRAMLEAATSRDPGKRPEDIAAFLNEIGHALDPSAAAIVAAPEDPEDFTPTNRGSVLVADDDGTMRMMLKALFEGAGLQVTTATDGSAAWDALRSLHHLDLVCTDLSMPGLHGHDLIRYLRRSEQFAQTPVVVMSGEEGEEVEATSRELGVAFHLKKPISIEDFQKVVNHFFGDR